MKLPHDKTYPVIPTSLPPALAAVWRPLRAWRRHRGGYHGRYGGQRWAHLIARGDYLPTPTPAPRSTSTSPTTARIHMTPVVARLPFSRPRHCRFSPRTARPLTVAHRRPSSAGTEVVVNGAQAGTAADGFEITAANCPSRAWSLTPSMAIGIDIHGTGAVNNTVQGCILARTRPAWRRLVITRAASA